MWLGWRMDIGKTKIDLAMIQLIRLEKAHWAIKDKDIPVHRLSYEKH